MSKIMTVDILSSIQGAKESEAVQQLFDTIKEATTEISTINNVKNAVSIHELREDIMIDSSQLEKEIIRENFPKEKNGYLVVHKVIEE